MSLYLLLTLDFPPERGGVARYYDGIARTLPAGSIAVLAPRHPLGPSFDATRRYPIFRRTLLVRHFWPRWQWIWFHLLACRRAFRYDAILVGNILPLGYPALIIRVLFGIPYDVLVHGLDLLAARRSPWKRFWAGVILRHARRVIANSHWTKSLVSRMSHISLAGGLNSGETHHLSVLYPCPSLPPASGDAVVRFKDRWVGERKKIILSVGRLVRRKGHDMALMAFQEIRRTHPDAHYVVIGDGPDRDRLMSLAASLGLGSAATFTGALPDEEVGAALGAADVFLLPTRTSADDAEGFGLVFLEAAAAGVPAIGGEGGGVGEAITDGLTGLVVNPRDPAAIAEAVCRLLDDPALCRRFGEAAQKRVLREFQWETQVLCLW